MINDLEIVQWDYLLDPAFQLVNTAGKPLTNGWIEVYIHGTRDKYYCASDFNGTLHPFQIPLDSLGSNIVLASPANAYDVYVYNVYGSLVMSRYNVKPGSGSGSGVIPADASYGIFGTNELPFNNTTNTGFQFTAKDIGGDDITFHEITYPYGRIDCKEGVYFYSATIEVSNTTTSNESVRFQVLAGKNPNQSIYWLDFDNSYLHKQLYTVCGIANFVNDDTFRINVSPYQLTNGVKASASQVAIHKLSTVVEGEGGGGGHEYGAGWGIVINNDEIAVDPSIIPTIEYVDASVSAVSSTLISTIESVSGNLQDQIDNIPAQVQSDWNQTDDTQVDYIKNKPDLTVYATHDEVCAVSSVLQNEIDNIDMSEYVTHTELNSTVTAVSSVLENEIQIVSAAIPDVSDFVTHDEVSAVSSNLVEYVDNSINNVSGDLVEYIDESVNNVSGDLIEYVDNSVNTASGNLVQYIDDSITEVNETIENVSGNIINEVNETINNVSGDLVQYIDNSVGAVSGDIIEYVDNTVNNVSGVLESEIQIVSGAIPVVTGYATKDEVNTVSSTIINTIEVVSGAIQDTIESVSGILQDEIDNIPEQVNADWNAVSGKAEILNKPDLSVYATHDEVDNVSGAIVQYIDDSIDVVNNNVTAVSSVLNDKIDTVSGAIIHYQGASGVNVDGDTISLEDPLYIEAGEHIEFSQDGDNITISADVSDIEADIQEVSGKLDELSATVASASGIEYGQFYSTGITTTPATMARVKGTIAVDNGKIQLKKGSSYHVTVRGRYNQTTAANTNSAVGYIEYVSNNTINVNVDKTITDSQYFEISYDLYNLSNNVDYLVWFTGTDGGTVNDLWIEVHSLTGIGGQGGGTGPGTEYTPGYGIQILNNVISVSGIAPQVQSDWAQDDNSEIDFIKNKPEEQALVAGNNINIQVSGSNVIISSTSDGEVTEQELAIVSGVLNSRINTVSGAAFKQSDWTEEDNTKVEFIKNKPTEYDLIGGQNVSVTVSGTNVIIDSTAGGDVTETELATVSGTLHTEIQSVSSAIPEEMSLVAGDNIDIQVSGASAIISSTAISEDKIFIAEYDTTSFNDIKDAYESGKIILARYNGSIYDVDSRSYSNNELSEIRFRFVPNLQYGIEPGPYAGTAVQSLHVNSNGWTNYTNRLLASFPWSYISNKPDLTVYATNETVTSVSAILQTEIETVSASIPAELTGASGVKIEDDVASLDDPIFVKAGSGIAITQDGDDIVISSTVTGSPQVNADWTAVSGAAEILNKPNEYNLIAGTNVVITKDGNDVTISARGGGGGGSSYIAGTGIDITNDVISVSGVAMASALQEFTAGDYISIENDEISVTGISAVSGTLSIAQNVTGAPLNIIYPTDVAPLAEIYNLTNNPEGTSGSGSQTYIAYRSPGYEQEYYTNSTASIVLDVTEAVTGVASIYFYYSSESNKYSSNNPTINTNLNFSSPEYTIQPGKYIVKMQANGAGAGSGYGKYITLMFIGPGPDMVKAALINAYIASPDPSLGVDVDLDRYYLGGNIVNNKPTNSGLPAQIWFNPETKKQEVYLPQSIPSSWYVNGNTFYNYTSTPTSINGGSDSDYIAYKYDSATNKYIYARMTSSIYDSTNNIKKSEFVTLEPVNGNFEKWTYDYSNSSNRHWTTETITQDMSDYATEAELQAVSGAIPEEINLIPGSGITIEVSGASAVISSTGGGGGSSYTAGDFIDITNNVISVDDTSNVVAGNGINITQSGNNTTISLGVTAGITDIQLVNSLPASPTSTVLYLIRES